MGAYRRGYKPFLSPTLLAPDHRGGFPGRMSVQPISNEDTGLQQLSDFETLSNMSSPVLSVFSDVVAPSHDENASSPSLFDDTDLNGDTILPVKMLSARSFLPFIELLPNLAVVNNQFYIDGPLVVAELEQFVSDTRRIENLILEDEALPTDDPIIALETLGRLGMVQDPRRPFLSSLKHLRIVDADQSLAYLFFFCVIPSLKSLEIAGVPATRQTTISSFLKELVVKAPFLSSITLGPGRIAENSIQSTLKFHHLRKLQLHDAVESLDFDFLKDISGLTELETLIIDAHTAEYQQRRPSSNMNPVNPDGIPFPCLRQLTIVANVLLMGDIIYHLFPQAIKEVSLTLVQNGQPLPLPPQWDLRQLEAAGSFEASLADGPTSLEQDALNSQGAADALVESTPSAPETISSNVASLSPNPSIPAVNQSLFNAVAEVFGAVEDCPVDEEEARLSEEARRLRLKREKRRQREEMRLRKIEAEAAQRREEETSLRKAEAEEMRLRQVEAEAAEQRERDRVTNIVSQSQFFGHIIEEILAMGSPDTFSIDRLEIAPLPNASDEQSPTLFPSIAFQTLLSYPILTELRFQHWSLPPIDEFLAEQSTASHPQPLSMEKLRLPVDNTLYPGIMVSTLEAITRYYPRLIDFECLIQTISSSQVAHLNDPPQIFSRGLEFLSVGGILPSSLDDKISMASHLCLLFPKLKKIRTHDGYDADGWRVVQSLVRMHQNLRTVEEGVRR